MLVRKIIEAFLIKSDFFTFTVFYSNYRIGRYDCVVAIAS